MCGNSAKHLYTLRELWMFPWFIPWTPQMFLSCGRKLKVLPLFFKKYERNFFPFSDTSTNVKNSKTPSGEKLMCVGSMQGLAKWKLYYHICLHLYLGAFLVLKVTFIERAKFWKRTSFMLCSRCAHWSPPPPFSRSLVLLWNEFEQDQRIFTLHSNQAVKNISLIRRIDWCASHGRAQKPRARPLL